MKNQLNVKRIAHDYTMPLFLLCLFVISMIFVPRFAEVGNLINVLMQITINALIATGMTFVILTGGIDLSVGSVAALTGIISSTIINTMPDSGIPMSILVIFGTSIIIGGICGAFNAFNVSQLKVPPFVATLAMMSIARGLAYVFTNAKPVFGMPEAYSWIGLGYIGIIPVMVIIMIIILGLAYLILNRTCFGRYVFAVGSSEDVSQLSEPGQDGAAAEVEARPAEREDLVVAADGDDPVAVDGDRGRDRAGAVERAHPAAVEEQHRPILLPPCVPARAGRPG